MALVMCDHGLKSTPWVVVMLMQNESMQNGPGSKVRGAWFLASLALFMLSWTILARAGETLLLQTNEVEIARLNQTQDFDIDNPASVFDAVFAALDDDITVLPSENYYFFQFYHHGVEHAGNFRLDAADRDKGIIHFAYFPRLSVDGAVGPTRHLALSAADGVKVTPAGRLTYVVIHAGKAVVFRLNDLSDVKPDDAVMAADEIFIGPVFDESGISFYLIWNKEVQVFIYILNEDMVSDDFVTSDFSGQIAIGRRSGFALYSDRYLKRRFLVGVSAREVLHNTMLDGPFDQMPDNFITSNALAEALIARRSDLAGRIDQRGNLEDLAGRVIIVPYFEYEEAGELGRLDQCAARAATRESFYRCFDRGTVKPAVGDEAAANE